MISGKTKLIAHLGYPTESFRAPMICNPYFEKHGIDAVVVPMGCKSEDYVKFLKFVFRLSNIHGALVTMPHKVTTIALLDEASTTAQVAGSCNAIRLDPDGRLVGDMFGCRTASSAPSFPSMRTRRRLALFDSCGDAWRGRNCPLPPAG